MMEWHWDYIVHVKRMSDGHPWPMRGPNVLIKGGWEYDQKTISIEPFHARYSSGLEVWWIERVKVDNILPPAEHSDYEKLREELQV